MTPSEFGIIVLLGFIGAHVCSGCAPMPEPTPKDHQTMAEFADSNPQPERWQPERQGDCHERPFQSWSEYSGCEFTDTVHLYGMGRTGEDPDLRDSATRRGHTERAQDMAPHHIRFVGARFVGQSGIPLYLGPGVHHVEVAGSTFVTAGESVAIYLDAETAHNVIADNTISHASTRREVIAMDGSAHNFVTGNTITRADRGGIYLYRNCGEDGVPRHQAPTFNVIQGNDFPSGGSVIVGSRQGNRGYCGLDDHLCGKLPGTSARSNLDWAQFNIVRDNPGASVVATQAPNLTE